MENVVPGKISIFGLIRNLGYETKTFIRQEAALAKTELTEKMSRFARKGAFIAAGGGVAFVGLIVFIMGLGWLLGWAFQQAGLAPMLASFLGLAVIGLFVAVAGGVLLLRAIKSISKQSLAPERTIRTIQQLQGKPAVPVTKAEPPAQPGPSSAELQSRVEATETRLTDTLDELGYRVSPSHIKYTAVHSIKDRPYYASLGALIAGFVSTFLIRRRFRRG